MILPDVLGLNLNVVFCGTAAGKKSAEVSAYYAGDGNRFWKTLAEICITPRILKPAEYKELIEYKVGLTDLAKYTVGCDDKHNKDDYDIESFHKKILEYMPRAIAFNGKKSASEYYHCTTVKLNYGRQSGLIGDTIVFVLPSTSGAARGHWNIEYWREVANLAK